MEATASSLGWRATDLVSRSESFFSSSSTGNISSSWWPAALCPRSAPYGRERTRRRANDTRAPARAGRRTEPTNQSEESHRTRSTGILFLRRTADWSTYLPTYRTPPPRRRLQERPEGPRRCGYATCFASYPDTFFLFFFSSSRIGSLYIAGGFVSISGSAMSRRTEGGGWGGGGYFLGVPIDRGIISLHRRAARASSRCALQIKFVKLTITFIFITTFIFGIVVCSMFIATRLSDEDAELKDTCIPRSTSSCSRSSRRRWRLQHPRQ